MNTHNDVIASDAFFVITTSVVREDSWKTTKVVTTNQDLDPLSSTHFAIPSPSVILSEAKDLLKRGNPLKAHVSQAVSLRLEPRTGESYFVITNSVVRDDSWMTTEVVTTNQGTHFAAVVPQDDWKAKRILCVHRCTQRRAFAVKKSNILSILSIPVNLPEGL